MTTDQIRCVHDSRVRVDDLADGARADPVVRSDTRERVVVDVVGERSRVVRRD